MAGIHKLSDLKARSISKPGRHSDGGGLYLRVRNVNAKSWAFKWVRDGKPYEYGLGGYPAVSLAAARELAVECRAKLAAGEDPRAIRKVQDSEPTFGEAAELYVDSMESQWSNEKHVAQWRMTLGPTYCGAIINRKVSTIGLEDVLRVLKPVWTKKPETASRLRGRIEKVLAFARVKGWRSGENPAIWRGNLDALLPAAAKLKGNRHFTAMAYGDLPAFFGKLSEIEGMGATALKFLILTAARTGEVLNARWDEIDLQRGLWTVPAERMKARKEHVVPLSDTALEILEAPSEVRVSDWMFPGMKQNRPLSNMSLVMVLRRLEVDATAHGFRSSFRDWIGDETDFDPSLAEAALAHTLSSKVEAAYRRKTAIEKRRVMMQAWAIHCTSDGKVSHLHAPH
jgi:integrase